MSHHHAITYSRDLGRGVTFTIQSGALRHQDVLDLQLAGDEKTEAIVENFDATGLSVSLNGSLFKCRPWRKGDAEVQRLPGTISSWTIEQIVEHAENGLHA